MSVKSTRLLPLLMLLMLGMLWGTGYTIARYVITHGVPAVSYSFWEALGPAVLLSALLLRPGQPPLSRISSTHLRYYLTAGLTGIAIPNTCMYFAAGHLPAGLLAVTVNTVPVFAWPLALMSGLESFSFTRLAGLTLAVTGLFFILIPRAVLPASGNWIWFLPALITPFSFAFCAVHITKRRPLGTGPVTVAAGMLLAAALMLVPLVLMTGGLYLPEWPLKMPDIFIILEMVLSALGYILFFELLRIAGPVYYSLVDTTVALTGLVSGYYFFGEKITPAAACGIVLILAGVLAVTFFTSGKQQNITSSVSPSRTDQTS